MSSANNNNNDNEDLKFFLANQAQSFAAPLLSVLLDQKNRQTTGLSSVCRSQLIEVSSAALKNEQWALRMFDSNGRLQSGMAQGSLFNLLGNYDQCIENNNNSNKSTSFCLAHIDLHTKLPFDQQRQQQQQQHQLVKFGFCAPSSCNQDNITLIARHLLNSSQLLRPISIENIDCHHNDHLEQQQQSDPTWWQVSTVLSVLLIAIVFTCSLVASASTYRRQRKQSDKQQKVATTTTTNLWCKTLKLLDTLLLFVDTFSISRNANKLTQKRKQVTNVVGGNLAAVDGLKVISTIWIIIIHSYNFAFQWLWFDNVFKVQHVYQSIWLQWIANGTFSIDNFFIISGFLAHLKRTTYLSGGGGGGGRSADRSESTGRLEARLVLRRYLRLVPTLLVAILLSVALFPRLSGLSFNMANTQIMFSNWCQKNWFLNVVLLQNWLRTPEQCFGHTWFIAADFQLLLAVQLSLYLFSRVNFSLSPKQEKLVMMICIVAIQFASAALAYSNRLQAMPVIPAESLAKLNDYFRLLYIKPYYWFSSYMIGKLLAMLVLENKTRPTKSAAKRGLFAKILFYSTSIVPVLMLATILLSLFPYFFDGFKMSSLQSALYVLLVRPLWSANVAFLLYEIICQPKRDFVVKTLRYLLSFRLWLPLSRLSYSAYLLHPVIMAIFYGSATSTFHYSSLLMIYFALGNIMITFASALVIYLLVEVPLQMMMLKTRAEDPRRA